MPVVLYLDNITVYRDTKKQVLEDILGAIKQLSTVNFALNLHEPTSPGYAKSFRQI